MNGSLIFVFKKGVEFGKTLTKESGGFKLVSTYTSNVHFSFSDINFHEKKKVHFSYRYKILIFNSYKTLFILKRG